MKKLIFCIAAIGMMAVMSCNGCSKSGKRLEERKAAEMAKKDSIKLEPKKDIDPGFSIGGGAGLDSVPGEIFGRPIEVTYSMDLNSWNMVVEKRGNDCRVKIDSATASSLIYDRSIMFVKVAGKKVTLLHVHID